MLVNHSGWNEKDGAFNYNIYVDENKTDYEIHYSDGSIAYQDGPFQTVTADWNCDGDRYAQFGAWFTCNGRGEFLTPENMVWQLLFDGDYNPRVVAIPGIDVPGRKQNSSLDDIISTGQRKALDRETEKNSGPQSCSRNSPDDISR